MPVHIQIYNFVIFLVAGSSLSAYSLTLITMVIGAGAGSEKLSQYVSHAGADPGFGSDGGVPLKPPNLYPSLRSFCGKGYPLLGVFVQENDVFVYFSDEMGENI